MKYDDILQEIGDIGPYQRKMFALLCLPVILVGTVVMSTVFVMTEPSHRCAIPGLLNDTYIIQNEYHGLLVNLSIPPATDEGDKDDQYSNCLVYTDVNNSDLSIPSYFSGSENSSRLTNHCKKWVYDDIDFKNSINTEFDLVCDDTFMRSITSMSMFGGALIGCVITGWLADMLGRKVALLLSISIQMVSGIAMYFIPSLVPVIVLRSFQGMSTKMFGAAVTTGMELMGPSKRTLAGVAIEFAWCGGQFIILAIAYFTRDWRIMQLICGVATAPIIIVLMIVLPESPRWLLDKGRFEEAGKILQKIADSNKKELPPGCIDSETGDEGPQLQIWEMFKHRVVVIRSLILFYNWFAVNLIYYGLSLNLDNLSGNLYLNFFISTMAETVAYVIVLILLDRTGRKRLHTLCTFIGSLSCLVVIFPVVFGTEDDEWTATVLAMIGKMAASCCYAILYIMTVEIFPTVVRNSGLACCSIFENTSAMTAPYIADLGRLVGGSLSQALPMLVFGGVSFLAALMSLHLPETLNKPLPETIEDAINFGREDTKEAKSDKKQSGIELKELH